MRPTVLFFSFAIFTHMAMAQTPHVQNPAFQEELSKLLSFSVKTMDVDQLNTQQAGAIILDAREEVEFEVSHIPGARHIGFNHPDFSVLNGVEKNATLVIYCSVGYRSEKIGEKLQNLGFTQVFNLYGSIFEWSNRGYALESGDGKSTNKLHTFNQDWSKWVTNPSVQKTW